MSIYKLDTLVVTPHNSFFNKFRGNSGIDSGELSYIQAINAYCSPFLNGEKSECPVCGKINCPIFKKECDKLLNGQNNIDAKRNLMRGAYFGFPFLQIIEEYKKFENTYSNNLKANNIIPTVDVRKEMFKNYMDVAEICSRVPYQGRWSFINPARKGSELQFLPYSLTVALATLASDAGVDNIKNHSEMNEAMRKGDWDKAVKSFHAKMQYTETNVSVLNELIKEAERKKKSDEEINAIKNAVSYMSGVNKTIAEQYGDKVAKIAKEMQGEVKGKKIRNYQQALEVFEKTKNNLNKKVNAKDRAAIKKALETLDKHTLANNLKQMGKAFGIVGYSVQAINVYEKTKLGFETGNWSPLFLELESIAAGYGASALVGVALSMSGIAAPSVLFFALLGATASYYLSADNMGKINNFIVESIN
ncbi:MULTISPECIES: colicin-like pore-forming protein [Photorhabdus]|nr:colicin-like pore-forming protein [Photorhabdus asymbiotica]RKS53994.1 colicin pore forming domain-containing protein [Photorhabdus asymbiotica]